jgi:hypothetical protein
MDHPLTTSGPDRRRPAAGAGRVAAELARLTPRDRWLLDLLDQHQVFTTMQITTLCYPSLHRASYRLRQLHHREVIDRFRHGARPGSEAYRWTLGPTGAGITATAAGRPAPRPQQVRAYLDRLATSPKLHHLLAVNDLFVTLAGHARHHAGVALTRWWSERRATTAAGNLVHPDGAGTWTTGGRQVSFFLEVDRGTEPLPRLASKLHNGYTRLAGTRLAWPVLFWLPNPAREDNLHQLLTRQGTAGVTVATATPMHGHPAGPVWRLTGRPDGTVRLALHQLPVPTPIEKDGS